MSKASIQQRLFYLVFSLLYFCNLLPAGFPGVGIDASWHLSLAMAVEQGLIFGTDFIFNYGPLGYLNTVILPKNVSPYLLFLFHLFILINYLFIIKIAIQKYKGNWLKVALAALMILLPWGFFADMSFTLFYLQIFWLLYTHKTRNTLALFIMVICAVLIFYIKVNLSIIAFGILLLSLLYFGLGKIISWFTVIFTTIVLFSITWSLSGLLNVSLPDYLAGSLKIIDAYQDGMAWQNLKNWELLGLFAYEGLMFAYLMYHLFTQRFSFKNNLYLYFLIILAGFLSFKQAHTATGHLNIFGFFLFMPALATLLFLFEQKKSSSTTYVFLIVLIFQLIITQYLRFSMSNFQAKAYLKSYLPNTTVQKIEEKGIGQLFYAFSEKSPSNYFNRLITYQHKDSFTKENIFKERFLDEGILNKIGSSTVDLMPWEISFIYFNQLNYQPRPVIQTYQANSDWLAQKNEAKYTSNNAPQFVLARSNGFREQHPFWVDKGAYLALAKNYHLVDTLIHTEGNYYLFEKESKADEIKYHKYSKGQATFNQEISIPNDTSLYFKAEIKYNWAGKLARLIFQPPYLKCDIRYEDNTVEGYRIPPPILKGGIYVGGKMSTESEFLNFYHQKKAANKKIKSIKFWSKIPFGFEQNFHYILEKAE